MANDEQIIGGENKNVVYMFGKEAADAYEQNELPYGSDTYDDYEVDDTVNIPQGEYEDLLDNSAFLLFLQQTVGDEIWQNALDAFDSWNEEQEKAGNSV